MSFSVYILTYMYINQVCIGSELHKKDALIFFAFHIIIMIEVLFVKFSVNNCMWSNTSILKMK